MTDAHPLERSANDFLETHKAWVQMTQEEVQVLRTLNFKTTTEVLSKKSTLSDTYERQLGFLHQHREELSSLPDVIKAALRKSQEEFEAMGAELQAELALVMKVSERFMNLIKRSMTKQLKTSHFYGQSGSLLDNAPPRSVTVNKKA